MSDTEQTKTTPERAGALGFTKAELRGCERLRDRIKFDLYVAPRDNDTARAWCARQEVALEVIEERIKHGR